MLAQPSEKVLDSVKVPVSQSSVETPDPEDKEYLEDREVQKQVFKNMRKWLWTEIREECPGRKVLPKFFSEGLTMAPKKKISKKKSPKITQPL